MITAGDLPGYLEAEIPGWGGQLSGRPSSTIEWFDALRAYILDRLREQNTSEVGRVISLIEKFETDGDGEVWSLAEMWLDDLPPEFWRFLDDRRAAALLAGLAWYPETENRDVDGERYRARWAEELLAIGGSDRLTTEQELAIRFKLKQEFCIQGLRAPEPGGAEWQSLGLQWPLKDGKDAV